MIDILRFVKESSTLICWAFFVSLSKRILMAKFVRLLKVNEKGVRLEEERWNVNYIKTYRKWTTEDKSKDLSVVYVEDSSAAKGGRLIVDNTVEDIDNQIEK